MSTGLFKVLKASAGSGKTYALVKQYLLLSLRLNNSRYYRQILAITFTNAAASEMKERVLERLKEFSNIDFQSGLSDEICNELHISRELLQTRAQNTYRDMLHNYGQLSILTIDSFTHRLIRSFSRDLHLSHDFNVEIESGLFLEKLIDTCLENIGIDPDISQYLENFAIDNIEDGRDWKLRDLLIDISGQLLKDDTNEALQKLDRFSLKEFEAVKKNLRDQNKKFAQKAIGLAQEAMNIFLGAEITFSDFFDAGRGTLTYLKELNNESIKNTPKQAVFKLLGREDWNAAKAKSDAKERLTAIVPRLRQLFIEITEHITEQAFNAYSIRKKILAKISEIGLLRTLENYSKLLKQEENTLLIADFHRLVNNIITDNEAPFIYERIGNRYKHILFDEFQDTSLLQWTNAIPLIQNSLAEGNINLIVGDAKQSIYRWRGGNVEQFIELPEIPIQARVHKTGNGFKDHIQIEQLEFNRRSAKSIVNFNNQFYKHLSASLGKFESVYADSEQKTTKQNSGYVRIERSEGQNKRERWPKTSSILLQHIAECLNEGFKPGDIAILLRKGAKEASIISALLSANHYQVVTRESFLIVQSAVARVIMAFLEFNIYPEKQFASVDLIQSLSHIKSELDFEILLTKYHQQKDKKFKLDLHAFLIDHFGEYKNVCNSGSVFLNTISALRYFNLTMDSGMEFLLEKIKQQCIVKNVSLHEFIQWWHDSKDKLYTTRTENENAINILTIHKSKGLQFPVVIYPRFATTAPPTDIWINMNEDEFGLPVALVQKTKSKTDDEYVPVEFDAETEKQKLDDINLCYVATTRAEERLYIIQETGDKTSLSKSIQETLHTHYSSFTETGVWEDGEKEIFTSHHRPTNADFVQIKKANTLLNSLKVLPLRNKLNSRRERGSLVHECLEAIKTHDDLDHAIAIIKRKTDYFDETEFLEMKQELEQILSSPETAKWFAPELKVILEQEICTSSGKILRPDRVIIHENHIDVIDYKTGIERQDYVYQVSEYCTYLNEIYNLPVHGHILYTNNLKVVSTPIVGN